MAIGLFNRRNGVASTRKTPLRRTPRIEVLETRLALSTATPAVDVSSARTTDSQSVTFDYDINTPNLPATIDFGVYRSADPVYGSSDPAIGSLSLATTAIGRSTLDSAGHGDGGGPSRDHLPIAGGLSIVPKSPTSWWWPIPRRPRVPPTRRPGRG